jgi:hypothetical protein
MNMSIKFAVFLFIVIVAASSFGQIIHKSDPIRDIYTEIEDGIARGNVKVLSKYLNSQTFFSLSNGTSGYYSTNQAFYILEDFFKIHPVISFKLRNIQIDENSSYAIGVYVYENKGRRTQSQIYISLVKTGKNWKINQLTIN